MRLSEKQIMNYIRMFREFESLKRSIKLIDKDIDQAIDDPDRTELPFNFMRIEFRFSAYSKALEDLVNEVVRLEKEGYFNGFNY